MSLRAAFVPSATAFSFLRDARRLSSENGQARCHPFESCGNATGRFRALGHCSTSLRTLTTSWKEAGHDELRRRPQVRIERNTRLE